MIPRAVENGVIYVAGEAFYVNGTGQNTIRLSFSAPRPDRIRQGVERLAATVRQELEALSDPAGRAARQPPAVP
jgi:DNA-binding transcriptional MocR family regulator